MSPSKNFVLAIALQAAATFSGDILRSFFSKAGAKIIIFPKLCTSSRVSALTSAFSSSSADSFSFSFSFSLSFSRSRSFGRSRRLDLDLDLDLSRWRERDREGSRGLLSAFSPLSPSFPSSSSPSSSESIHANSFSFFLFVSFLLSLASGAPLSSVLLSGLGTEGTAVGLLAKGLACTSDASSEDSPPKSSCAAAQMGFFVFILPIAMPVA
mmetsp:Transcript_10373/g.24984  ORF Transcript_10373/g.24984 Transcript_10373/m.24984 type:complete len:211 (+) Transcript_10373:540-1172(+)